jgi:hypothetical protein
METLKEFEYFAGLLKESDSYDSEKLYSYDAVVSRLKKGPGYMKQYIPKLKQIPCTDSNGNKTTCTQIPEVVFNYIYHRNF